MKIKHDPLTNVQKVAEHYSEKDGVPVEYVCTTDLLNSDQPFDVFYRETPHPEFGNRYFGLQYNHTLECMMITNADIVESFQFGMIEHDLEWYYSQFHHDYISLGQKIIDGGRQYVRGYGFEVFKIKDGEFIDEFG